MKNICILIFLVASIQICHSQEESVRCSSIFLEDLLGYYMADNNESTLLLSKSAEGNYVYTLNTGMRKLVGNASLSLDTIYNKYYVVLNDIEWFVWLGCLSDNEHLDINDAPEHSDTFGVDFFVSPDTNELFMQNTGNSMNYYVKIEEWDSKYVTFRRTETLIDDF